MSIGSISLGSLYSPQPSQQPQGGSKTPSPSGGDTVTLSKAALNQLKSGDADGDGDSR